MIVTLGTRACLFVHKCSPAFFANVPIAHVSSHINLQILTCRPCSPRQGCRLRAIAGRRTRRVTREGCLSGRPRARRSARHRSRAWHRGSPPARCRPSRRPLAAARHRSTQSPRDDRHEVPQELGDFGILIRGGWSKVSALVANFVSAATIVPGGLLAYYLSADFDITFLLSFAAGNFLYIAASDLIPEVKHDRRPQNNLVHFGAFVLGVGLILGTRAVFHT